MRDARYISTRGKSPELTFEDILLSGIAPDGGLYLPDFSDGEFANLVNPDELKGKNYAETAYKIILPFIKGSVNITEKDLRKLCMETYTAFDHTAVAPLKQFGNGLWGLELFHGPTFAFKDYALQLVGRMFDHVLKKKNEHLTVIGATSGDTGSAAIYAIRYAENADIFMLHPFKKVSEIQRKQMVTINSKNVHNLAVKGNFDDCQAIVKTLFTDSEFNKTVNLGAVNSINFARILAQVVYYFYAGINLDADTREIDIVVPTGNFGNILAAYLARKMGLKINRLIIASNANDILPRFIKSGKMERREALSTLSPSMDIQVSSNFERLLYYATKRNTETVTTLMNQFKEKGIFTADKETMKEILNIFDAASISDKETLAEIKKTYDECKEIIDPHSAVALATAKTKKKEKIPILAVLTAHPAKFAPTVKQAIGRLPVMPPALSTLEKLDEKYDIIENNAQTVKRYILKTKLCG